MPAIALGPASGSSGGRHPGPPAETDDDFTYCYRDTAETMAAVIATEDKVSIAVFAGLSNGKPATCICPLGEFGQPDKLIAIYDPR